MRYQEYRDRIERALRRQPAGMTWSELRETLDLPYERPCPNWTKRLEAEIGLARVRGAGRALVWKCAAAARNGKRKDRI
ncbi:MAG: hypothetical protein KDA42_18905 [Planctomycetales bacterium]|nr:hypothetical protein [Planctomycetales bacterium]